MKASKFIVLAGGLLGIIAFFLPLVSVDREGGKATVSAYQVIKGGGVEVSVEAEGRHQRVSVDPGKKDIGALKGIVMAFFAPALILTAIGGAGVGRKRFGRVAGTFSVLLGLVGLGIGALLKGAADGDSGSGLTILMLTGVLGIVGGVIALAKPDRGEAAATNLTSMPRAAA